MSERGAEGILARRRADAATTTTTAAPAVQHDVERTPGRAQRAAAGAAGGAAGGPGGAAAGAVLGALGGGKKSRRGGGNKVLVGEFLLCVTVVLLAPLTGSVEAGPWMRRASAVLAVFALLGFLSSLGDTPRRVANGLGLLVTLALVIAQQSVFSAVLDAVNGSSTGTGPAPTGTPAAVVTPTQPQTVVEQAGGPLAQAGFDALTRVANPVGSLINDVAGLFG